MESLHIDTYAGTGSNRSADGPRLRSNLGAPTGLYRQGDDVYICDYYGNSLRKLDTKTEKITTIAGNGHEDGETEGDALSVALPTPRYVFPDGTGGWVITSYNHAQIMLLKDGRLSLLAGNAQSGFQDGTTAEARFDYPRGGCVDARTGSIFIADYSNHRIRVIGTNGMVTSIGSGVKGSADGASQRATFNGPLDMCVAPSHAFYVCELGALRIIDSTSFEVTTYAGAEVCGVLDGPRLEARFSGLTAIAWRHGTIFLSDFNNHSIRVISPTGMVSTLSGSTKGFKDGSLNVAQMSFPWGLCLTKEGHLLISDSSNNRIRIISNVTDPIEESEIDIDDCSFSHLKGFTSLSGPNIESSTSSLSLEPSKVTGIVHPALAQLAFPSLSKTSPRASSGSDHHLNALSLFLYDSSLPNDTTAEEIISIIDLVRKLDLPRELLPHLYYELSALLPRLTVAECISAVSHINKTCPNDSQLLEITVASIQPRIQAQDVPTVCKPLLQNDPNFAVSMMTRLLHPQKVQLPSAPTNAFRGYYILKKLQTLYWRTIATPGQKAQLQPSDLTELDLDAPLLTPNFCIVADDGSEVKVHDWVLYARWPYFRRLMNTNLAEANARRLELPSGSMDRNLLLAFLHYIYTQSTASFDSDMLRLELLHIASLFDLVDLARPPVPNSHFKRLIEHCQVALDGPFTVETCVSRYKVLAELGSPVQVAAIGRYLLDNFSTLMKTPEVALELQELGARTIGEMWLRSNHCDPADWKP